VTIGYIVIGRNEGKRLERCLGSLNRRRASVVYVDSGSSDDSLEIARRAGVEIVELSKDKPFTAARARNAGFRHLMDKWPKTTLIMFIDGDCEFVEGFAEEALAAFDASDDIGVVTGRCREMHRDASVYNLVCDMEWDGPVGDIDACGGIFMARAAVFAEAKGFNPAIIAAEDDDFCIRVRGNGWRVHRLARDMCFHDAAMTRFGQWWRRAFRAGHAYEQVAGLHEGYFKGPRRRAVVWGAAIPALAIAAAAFTNGLGLILLALYPLSFIRTAFNLVRSGASLRDATIYSGFLMLSKFANLLGMLDYRGKRLFGADVAIVEYK